MNAVAGLKSSSHYEKFVVAQANGRRIAVRIQCITDTLHQRLEEIAETGRAFLVVDNLDQCSLTLMEILERELSVLQKMGLGIMLTLRLPEHEKRERVWCDFHDRGPSESHLQFFWRCTKCEMRYMCEGETCYNPFQVCAQWYVRIDGLFSRAVSFSYYVLPMIKLTYILFNDEITSWAEPEHLILPLECVSKESLKKYVAWNLEREHGDLGLGTSVHKPPLSSFGLAFRRAGLGHAWIERVIEHVNESILQTKLALDRVHASKSPEEFARTDPSRVPSNLQALYHNALKAIGQQSNDQYNLGLSCVAAVGNRAEQGLSLPVNVLADLLRGRPDPQSGSRVLPRSVEDILTATKGYLTLQEPREGQIYLNVIPFDVSFFRFINQDYSDEIRMANALLGVSTRVRSRTEGPQKALEAEQQRSRPSRQDFSKELSEYQLSKLETGSTEPSAAGRNFPWIERSQRVLTF